MKRFFSTIILLAVAGIAVCQDTVRYPFPCYMEWPMPPTMGLHLNNCDTFRLCPYDLGYRSAPTTHARQFNIDTPTVIYGIAATLCKQDTLKRPMSVTLFIKKRRYLPSETEDWSGSSFAAKANYEVIPVKTMRWTESMPFRYVMFESTDYVSSSPTYGQHFEEAVKSYEFYFDTPIVVSDTFFVGYQTLGEDGLQHPGATDPYMAGWVYMALTYNYDYIYHDDYEPPIWRHIYSNIAGYGSHWSWAGLYPITEHPPCNPDTLSCSSVYGLRALPLMSGEVRFTWHQQPSHRQFQISVGPQGTPPDDNPIYEAAGSPFSISDNWDSSILYAAYIRAQCSRYCHPDSTLVWSDWSRPVTFYTDRSFPQGIHSPDKEQNLLFDIVPNPTDGRVTVTIDAALPDPAACRFTLLDAAGHEVLSATPQHDSRTFTLSLQHLPSGSYFLRMSSPQGSSTRKVVLQTK